MADDATRESAVAASTQNPKQAPDSIDAPNGSAPSLAKVTGLRIAGAMRRRWALSWRKVWMASALFAMCAVIAVDVHFMVRDTSRTHALASSVVKPPPAAEASQSAVAESSSAAASSDVAEPPLPEFADQLSDGEPNAPEPEEHRHFKSVSEAAARSCSTASVEGLSRQIIDQARCINPNAYVPLPRRRNLSFGSHVFPYLEVTARDHLLRALDAHRDGTMTVNSALRTVAQQYLVWRWSANKRCGVQLATAPGESNHETGLALDIAEQAKWRRALEEQDFHWLGAIDRVHFDYKGSGVLPHRAMDVRAFQRLWDRNHPDDLIAEDGQFSPATELRLKQAPADGFKWGPSCARR